MKWFWIVLALLYVISRFDLIPDMIPLYGWIDDIAVMVFLFRYLKRLRRMQDDDRLGAGSGWGMNGGQSEQQGSHGRTSHADGHKSPHEVLNVPPTADEAQIRAAYRRLASQYHPDKVAHLGKEFQDLAENRFKEIQQAYELLIGAAKR